MGNIQSTAGGAAPTGLRMSGQPKTAAAFLLATNLSHATSQAMKRQVFISHTGKDEGAKNFAASILKPALEAAGLPVFMDFSSLQLGSKWRQELVDAAQSMVVVVVLSKNFSNQFWCMLELDQAMHAHRQQGEAGKGGRQPLVIPVFYDSVDVVIDVGKIRRRWSGDLRRQLQEEEELGAEWVEAVDVHRWVDNIVAMKGEVQHLRRRLPDQAARKDEDWQLARGVVRAAASHIPSVVDVSGGIVGFEEQEAALAAELGGRLGLWLYGQGGGGKSTMAKLLFNRLSDSFSHSAYVEIQFGDGSDKMAQHIASALTAFGATRVKASDGAPVLSWKLKEFVKDKKLLFVLDNVWVASQLTALLPTNWGEGSVVIVTSRFESFADSSIWPKVHKQLHCHQLAVLEEAASRKLFRQAAGLEGGPDATLQEVEAAILAACGGLPLALQLLGGQLYQSNDVAIWQGTLAALKAGDPAGDSGDVLEGVLTHSLLGLKASRVSMFLDVATILRDAPLELVMTVWTAWHGPAAATYYKDLVSRSLLGDSNGRLVMHDVMVALGRGVILHRKQGLEEHYGSRLWVQDGHVLGYQQAAGRQVLAAQVVARGHRWTAVPGSEGQPAQLTADSDLSKVRILHQLAEVTVKPRDGAMRRKVARYCAIDDWGQLSQGLLMLVVPRSEGSLTWEGLASLKVLDINATGLRVLPESFSQVAALQTLNLSWSTQLVALPGSFGQLVALQTLDMRGCEQLKALPTSFGQLAALQKLDLSWCRQLAALPDSFGRLTALQALDLRHCQQLTALPQSFGQLAALQAMNISWEKQSLGQLTAGLHPVNVGRYNVLTGLPESFGRLSALTALNLGGYKHLTTLPESFGQLAALQELDLSDCNALRELPGLLMDLKALHKLDIEGCISLAAVPSWGQLPQLSVRYDNCHRDLVFPTRSERQAFNLVVDSWHGDPGGVLPPVPDTPRRARG